MDYNQAVGLPDEPLNIEITALVERAVAARAELPRQYLGASAIGHECWRQVQYDQWCKPLLPARVKMIFARGHFFESLAREQLVAAGFAFAPVEALEFVALDGDLRGHADGIIIAKPAMPGVYLAIPCVWEAKALNAKNFRAVARDGLVKVFPRYAVQVAVYQRFLDKLNPALVSVVNSDTCETLHFALPYSAERAQRAIDRAAVVIAANKAGELLSRFTTDPNDWRCQVCPHRTRCWR